MSLLEPSMADSLPLKMEHSSVKGDLLSGNDELVKVKNFGVLSHKTIFTIFTGFFFAKGL